MTARRVCDKFKAVWGIRKEIKVREEYLEELRTEATHITSILSHTSGAGGTTSSKPENYAVKAYELRLDLEDRINELYELMQETERMLKLIDPVSRAILIDYHYKGLNLGEISRKYHYSPKQLYNIRWKAYRQIADNY